MGPGGNRRAGPARGLAYPGRHDGGEPAEDAAGIVERLRGRTTAAAFAQRHHAGTADEHIGRYRLLADRGVKTVFVSLPHLADPEDIGCLAPVAAAFA